MSFHMRLAAILLMTAWPAFGQALTCAPPPDRTQETAELFAQLEASRSPGEASLLSALIWRIWLTAPDDAAQGLLDRGMAARSQGDYPASVAALGDLIAYCPGYAEGWNQRAFSAFLAQDFAAALTDLDRALTLEPRHLGALTGRAMTHIRLGNDSAAARDLRAALRLNRWLAERALLDGLQGTDI